MSLKAMVLALVITTMVAISISESLVTLLTNLLGLELSDTTCELIGFTIGLLAVYTIYPLIFDKLEEIM